MSVAPLVSIIIPCFNAARWLPATLDSVLAQTYSNAEIITVDDGSTDESRAILEDYRNQHGISVFAKTSGGAAAARNYGFSRSRGELIKFLDADDLISPDSLAVQVAALSGKPHHLAVGAWSRFHHDPEEANFRSRPGWRDAGAVEWIKETWTDTEPMYQCGLFLMPRSLLNRAGDWDERLSLIDDFEFFTRLVLASDGVVHTPSARVYYRSGLTGSLSAQKTRAAWESAILSTTLGTGHLLTRENTPQTRRLSANLLQQLVYSLHPAHPDLVDPLLNEIDRLGGADILPGGGRSFRLLAHVCGWRTALALRRLLRTSQP